MLHRFLRFPRYLAVIGSCALGLATIVATGGGGGGGGSGTGPAPLPATTFDAGKVEAQGTVTTAGGVIEVLTSASPLYGTKVTYWEDSIANEETIEILHHSQYPPLPSDVKINGPVTGLTRSGTENFNTAVLVELPVAQQDVSQEDEYIEALTYDEELKEWVRVQSWYAYEEGKIIMLPLHFSKFVAVTARRYKAKEELYTTFNMQIDTLDYENDDGVCAGMSSFTQWYFDRWGHGLRCRYNWDTARNVSIEAHDAARSIYNVEALARGALGLLATYALGDLCFNSTFEVLYKNLDKGLPTALTLCPPAHAIVVFAWVSTHKEFGYFLAYDVNDNSTPIKIHAWLRALPGRILRPVAMESETYPFAQLFGVPFQSLDGSSSYPPANDFAIYYTLYDSDYACGRFPLVAGDWKWEYQWEGQEWGEDTLRFTESGVWENLDMISASGRYNLNLKHLTVEFRDPTFLYHSSWSGNLDDSNNTVTGTMIQFKADDQTQVSQGVFTGTRINAP